MKTVMSTAKRFAVKAFWFAAALFFSTMAISQTADKQVNGRLIDLVCGSMVLRGDRYVVMHAAACLKDPRDRGGLAILTDNNNTVIHLTDKQEQMVLPWRRDLAYGEVYVYFDKDGKIQRNILPK